MECINGRKTFFFHRDWLKRHAITVHWWDNFICHLIRSVYESFKMWCFLFVLAPSHPKMMKNKRNVFEKSYTWLSMVEANQTHTHTQMSSITILPKKKHDNPFHLPTNLPIRLHILVGYIELDFNVMIANPSRVLHHRNRCREEENRRDFTLVILFHIQLTWTVNCIYTLKPIHHNFLWYNSKQSDLLQSTKCKYAFAFFQPYECENMPSNGRCNGWNENKKKINGRQSIK